MGRTAAFVATLAFLLPSVLSAQGDQESLRAQIRADLMKDPRTAQLSGAEIDALVIALAQEVEEQGTAAEYLESQNTFDPASLFSPPEEPSIFLQMALSPLGLAIALLAALLIAIGSLIFYRHSHHRPLEPDTL